MTEPFYVAIVGRPNVGKSTLFNRLVGKKMAIVDNTPGVTRDYRIAPAHIGDIGFLAVDTAGLEDAKSGKIEAGMRAQTERALEMADLILFMIDARAGVTPLDEHFASVLRASDIPVRLIANKAEGSAGDATLYEAFSLGLGDPIGISSVHGDGMIDLGQLVLEEMQAWRAREGQDVPQDEAFEFDDKNADQNDAEKPIHVALIGRPNVGKSTLLNALLDEERALTSPMAGTTRDAISVQWVYNDRQFRLVDTAGLRKKAKIDDKLEKLSLEDTFRAIRLAHVCVLVIDAEHPMDKQDLQIARMVADEGRAMVIALNKWDAVAGTRDKILKIVEERLEKSLPQWRGVPVETMSALNGTKLDKIMQHVIDSYDIWNVRLPTSPLNEWLADRMMHHPPPLTSQKRPNKLKFITQYKARPPSFSLSVSQPDSLPDSYVRYLTRGLQDDFDLWGIPLRVKVKTSDNPYANRAKKKKR